ncbi:hypothetical protein TFUB4_00496 [Tannerella forsythia]|nr:hypothetical protein TFUB4_00496 [Tannerella forsythia]
MSLFPCQGWNLLSFRGKVVLYQLSYFRTIFFTHLQSADVAFPLPRLEPFIFWGKVVLYQLSYFRTILATYFYD